MGRAIVFHLAFAILAVHEMDAVANREWRVLPLLNLLPEHMASASFLLLHVPLFAVLIWLCWTAREKSRERSRALLAGFLVIHAGLHALYHNHPEYAFHSFLSESLIFGGALLGLLYLAWPYFGRRQG